MRANVNDCPWWAELVESVKVNLVGKAFELVTVDVTIAVVVTVAAAIGPELAAFKLGKAWPAKGLDCGIAVWGLIMLLNTSKDNAPNVKSSATRNRFAVCMLNSIFSPAWTKFMMYERKIVDKGGFLGLLLTSMI